MKDFIVDVLGEAQVYRVSDAPLVHFQGAPKRRDGLRAALNELNDKISATSGGLSDAKLFTYFEEEENRYEGLAGGLVAFVYGDTKSSAQIVFSHGWSDTRSVVSVERVVFNGIDIAIQEQ